VLLITFAVYFYRDVFPLATLDWPVQDAVQGKLLWAKVSLLTLAAIVIPLVVPRMYVPVDPKASRPFHCEMISLTFVPQNPAENPAPEQVASILSLALYFVSTSTETLPSAALNAMHTVSR